MHARHQEHSCSGIAYPSRLAIRARLIRCYLSCPESEKANASQQHHSSLSDSLSTVRACQAPGGARNSHNRRRTHWGAVRVKSGQSTCTACFHVLSTPRKSPHARQCERCCRSRFSRTAVGLEPHAMNAGSIWPVASLIGLAPPTCCRTHCSMQRRARSQPALLTQRPAAPARHRGRASYRASPPAC